MIKRLLLFALSSMATLGFGQKIPIQSDLSNWKAPIRPTQMQITCDGKVAAYVLSAPKEDTLVIRRIHDDITQKIPRGSNPAFSLNGRYLLYQIEDTLLVFNLKTNTLERRNNVIASEWVGNDSNKQQILYTTGDGKLYLTNSQHLDNTKLVLPLTSHWRSANKRSLIVKGDRSFDFIDIQTGVVNHISVQCTDFANVTFSTAGDQAVLTSTTDSSTRLWHYSSVSQKLNEIKIPGTSFAVEGSRVEFSGDENYVLFQAIQARQLARGEPAVIWRYQDTFLPSQFTEATMVNRPTCLFSYGIQERKIICVTKAGEQKVDAIGNCIVVSSVANWGDWNWNAKARPTYSCVSLKDGARDTIVSRKLISYEGAAPDQRYLVFYDREAQCYYSYNVGSKRRTNITAALNSTLWRDSVQSWDRKPSAFGIGGWLKDQDAVLIYDKFDIWLVDLNARTAPVNVTMGIGKKNQTALRTFNPDGTASTPVFTVSEAIILAAFNIRNKQNGFYKINSLKKRDAPVQLAMSDCLYYYPHVSESMITNETLNTMVPRLVDGKRLYLLQRQSTTELPNFYLTSDFRSFTELTDCRVDCKYNLVEKELLHFYGEDGSEQQGILYKPQNFDSTRKYPVIFFLYENQTDYLHQFVSPVLSDGSLPVVTFVSNDYLVFDPGIVYQAGRPLQSACDAVTAAVRYLSKLSYIDSSKMGLQGISWGAAEVNFILTRICRFAAAASSAGVADVISNYNSIRPGSGVNGQYHAEFGQGRMGGSLWEKKNNYLESTSVLYADKVCTPLLIEHNDRDEAVSFSQGVEWFMALKRLQKKVWMVQYMGEGHGIYEHVNQLDFTKKLKNFFDYFLKGMPAPAWMIATAER